MSGVVKFAAVLALLLPSTVIAAERPNVLFIISEDTSPDFGAYGDEYAVSPNIDRLASEGLLYEFCWSNAPVCAPARTTLFSGMYATSTGAQHMRSLVKTPESMRFFPELLQQAGYYTANLRKEDFNIKTKGKIWDWHFRKMSARPWRKAAKAEKPFFAVFNISTSHESRIRERPHTLVHDPEEAPIPAYHPDTPKVRHDWAQYYDKLTKMDRQVGAILDRLAEDGHADDTIVFYFGDHGSGMPRSKRWPYDSGEHVPLVIRIPEMYQELRPEGYRAGGRTDRLVAFVDFAPTVLSLAGIEPPDYYQGSAFLGPYAGQPNEFLFGFRGRMDERIDMMRSVTDGRYVYVRNYMPHRIYGQHLGYMWQTPTTRVWERLYQEGKLNEAQSAFWEPKPTEELYDLKNDPDEVNNLANSPEHQDIIKELRAAHRQHVFAIRDVGFLPEPMLHAKCEEHDLTPYELGHNKELYSLKPIFKTAQMATRRDPSTTATLINKLDDQDPAIRYWALTGLLVRGEEAFGQAGAERIAKMLEDPSASVRIVAAELCGRYGDRQLAKKAVAQLLHDSNYKNTSEYAAASALLVVDELLSARPKIITSRRQAIQQMPLPSGKDVNRRAKGYPGRLKRWLLKRLEGKA